MRALPRCSSIYITKRSTFVNSDKSIYCSLDQSPKYVYKLQKGFIFAKNSPYTDLFDHHIGMVVETKQKGSLERFIMLLLYR